MDQYRLTNDDEAALRRLCMALTAPEAQDFLGGVLSSGDLRRLQRALPVREDLEGNLATYYVVDCVLGHVPLFATVVLMLRQYPEGLIPASLISEELLSKLLVDFVMAQAGSAMLMVIDDLLRT